MNNMASFINYGGGATNGGNNFRRGSSNGNMGGNSYSDGSNSFSNFRGDRGGYQGGRQDNLGGSVLIVYGLHELFTCQRLFNLLCQYGNVLKVSFMKTKKNCAMVEMSDPDAVDRVMSNLRNTHIFGNKLSMERSKKPCVEEIRHPHELHDKSPSYVNYRSCKSHRFDTEARAAKNRIVPPSSTLHFYNVPSMSDEELTSIFQQAESPTPSVIKWFEAKANAKSVTGLLRFDTVEEACEALVMTNHAPAVKPDSGSTYEIKLCFSNAKSRDL